MFGVDQIVVGGVRPAEHRKTLSMLFPGKLTTVDDDATQRRAMPSHELRQRMNHNIRAVFDRSQEDRRGDRIINDQRNAMFMGYPSQSFDIADVSRRIADTFAKDRPRLIINQFFYGAGLIRVSEADGDSLIRQDMSEQRVGSAIELRNRDDIASQLGNAERCIIDGCLP